MKRLVTWLKAKVLAWLAPEILSAGEWQLRCADWKRCAEAAAKGLEEAAEKLKALQRGSFDVVEHDEPKWTPDDSDTWRHFLLTNGAGQKLAALANFHEQACNRNAILRKEGAENNTGFARGWHMATAYFFKTLSAEIRPQQDPDTQQGDDASRLRERVAP